MTEESEYIASLKPKEKEAYEIAKKHLGSLLTLEKTTHYIKWSKDNKDLKNRQKPI